jgi:hypothetical protein
MGKSSLSALAMSGADRSKQNRSGICAPVNEVSLDSKLRDHSRAAQSADNRDLDGGQNCRG